MLCYLFVLSLIFAASSAYDQVCYEDLGCFTNAPPWGNTALRPLNVLPDSPEKVNTRFYLDTRYQTGKEIYYQDMLGLTYTTFNPSRYTRFITHGYIENGNVNWMEEMSTAFLTQADENIIRVGWMGASLQLNYASSAVDTQIVGATVANMINNMVAYYGMSSSQFHCVGHSLGAHACGYAGSESNGLLDRISGLDPAGPYFEGTPVEVRLDATDADFVDVIHSDAVNLKDVGFGTAQQSGDVDFWPNDGKEQPGCDQNALSTIIGIDGIADGTKDFVACNHIRAVKFFTESIYSTCPFKSYPCLSYDDFLKGKCLDCDETGCPQMGYHADSYRNQVSGVRTYLSTNALSPFCEYMTDIGIQLGSISKSIDGSLYITLYGPNGATEQQQIGGEDAVYSMRSGGYYSALVYYDFNPGGIEYVKLLWQQEEIELIGKQYITIDSVTVWAGMIQQRFFFCEDVSVEMKELTRYTLNPGSC